MNVLKILYLINYAGKAGTEKYVYNLVKKYHKKRAIVYFAYNIEGPLCDKIRSVAGERKIIPKQIVMRHVFDFRAAKTLAKYCEDNDIDIIHTQYPRENYIAILAKRYHKSLKVVYTSHLTIKTGLLWKISNSVITRNNHKIIAVCNAGKELLVKNGFPRDKIEVIFNGVREDEKAVPDLNLKKALGIDEGTFTIAILARYEESKGLVFLIETIKRLKEITKRKFVLLICGDGILYEEIRELIQEYDLQDCVKQLGFRTDAANILAISDLYVNSSKCLEALSFAMLEALLNGLPIVATNVGGNSDVVSSKNNCGILVEYGDADGMAESIKLFMDDKKMYKECSKNAVNVAHNVFDLDKLLDDTFKTYY